MCCTKATLYSSPIKPPPLKPPSLESLPRRGKFHRLLRLVWMLGTSIHLELAVHLLAQFGLRKHSLNGFLYHAHRPGLAHDARLGFGEAAGITRMAAINLLLFFSAGEPDLAGVYDHDVIAHIEKRRVGGLILAHK